MYDRSIYTYVYIYIYVCIYKYISIHVHRTHFKQAVAGIPCIPDFKEGFPSRTCGPRLELNDEQMRAKDALKTEEELKSEVPV